MTLLYFNLVLLRFIQFYAILREFDALISAGWVTKTTPHRMW
jgi:hypothetical protein